MGWKRGGRREMCKVKDNTEGVLTVTELCILVVVDA